MSVAEDDAVIEEVVRLLRSVAAADRTLLVDIAAEIALVIERRRSLGAMDLSDEIHELETRRIRHALLRHNGNVSEAARELRVGRARVYRVLQRSRAKKR